MFPRAVQSARAAGREPDSRHKALGDLVGFEAFDWAAGIGYWHQNQGDPQVAVLLGKLRPLVRDVWNSLGQQQRGLIVSHGGLTELCTLALSGEMPIIGALANWHCGYGEGFLLEGDTSGALTRVTAVRN